MIKLCTLLRSIVLPKANKSTIGLSNRGLISCFTEGLAVGQLPVVWNPLTRYIREV